ncbi:uncharacterized protein [Leptinotarsa decemlineata]|uniref:uncharacterized protein n=1 Tax=Leptinotarsa decemlineata TaxID=7539 RepID=UPI003D30417D
MEGKGYISKIDSEEIKCNLDRIWFLPHFEITNPNKPNKLRIVFDASARSNGVSLNDFLLTGPDLYNSLQNILLNFRIKKFAFTSDIKEMFLRIKVRKEDRISQRILYRGMERTKQPDIYEINVFFFDSTCGPCLAQEAKNSNAQDFSQYYPKAAEDIIDAHYMDDYLGGADTAEEAAEIINDVIYVHSKGNFEICNWIANDSNILKDVDDRLLADCKKKCDKNESSNERIVGIWWGPKNDTFTFKINFHKIDKSLLDTGRKPSKREVLKVVMWIFDLLGFLANFIVQGKILLQDIWRSKIDWDDDISDNLYMKWTEWIDDQKIFITSNFHDNFA